MADLPPAGAAHGARFAGGIGRHVVMVNIAFIIFLADSVQGLPIAQAAQGGNGHNLGLSAGKYGATVRARQNTHLAPNGADFILLAAIGPNAAVDDLVSHDLLG
ncbi:hypothetical protein SDC9_161713 [bioreactor metagenome]|uniref:Uncharacterized protein n=1 Tax=bioreactor metagenome TaxID=1076179 RepID=A0A645FL40_9ZZZZ